PSRGSRTRAPPAQRGAAESRPVGPRAGGARVRDPRLGSHNPFGGRGQTAARGPAPPPRQPYERMDRPQPPPALALRTRLDAPRDQSRRPELRAGESAVALPADGTARSAACRRPLAAAGPLGCDVGAEASGLAQRVRRLPPRAHPRG